MENKEKEEIWKELVGYIPKIFISNKGNVKCYAKNKLITPRIRNNCATIHINGKPENFNIILLIRQYFIEDEILYEKAKLIKDLQGEIWKDIKGYEGLYQISNLGRAKSIENSKSDDTRKWYNRVNLLKQCKNANGYCHFFLTKNKIKKRVLAHRIIAEAFIPNPENKPYINHKNSNPSDNSLPNLEWVTTRENGSHSSINKKYTSKYVGVSKGYKGSWCAHIRYNGKQIGFYGFKTEEEAYAKYLSVLKEHGIKNMYAEPLPEKRELWKKPYYQQSSNNYKNR